jgi:hypothetical protein
MRVTGSVAALCAAVLLACSAPDGASEADTPRETTGRVAASGSSVERASAVGRADVPSIAGRTTDLADPSAEQVVIVLHQLAALPLPLEEWAERDARVTGARGGDRAQQRAMVRAELEAIDAAMRQVGVLRLSIDGARLSEYDAGYGEFTIGALAPSSTIPYRAFGREVAITFANAASVQTLSMPADSARVLLDAIGAYRDPAIDLVLALTGAIPDRQGGTVQARVVQYELRSPFGGGLLLRRRF